MALLDEKILNLPATPGVYLFKGQAGDVLYVGKAQRLSARVRSYLGGDPGRAQIRDLMAEAVDLDVILTDSEVEALLLEATLIRQHRPRYNILLKDDKTFPYVRVSVQEEFPRLSVTRQVQNDGARYLGPFTDVKILRRTLREVRRIFPVRTCRNFEDHRRDNRPCLYYHIRRCVGPCYRRAAVQPAEYRSLVDGLVLFLTGRDAELQNRLAGEMGRAAEERRYEQAARLRDQLRLLDMARTPQKVVSQGGPDVDVLGVARHGARSAVVQLRIRAGRMVGKETRFLRPNGDPAEAQLLASFIALHYLGVGDVPRRIVTRAAPEGAEVLAAALARHAGHAVDLASPVRGREHRLVGSAERNAALALEDLVARRAGRKARFEPATLELQRALGLETPPHRMVCFDISNLGGEGAVAAVVASEDGRPRKSLYRRMRMRSAGPDDVAMIGEAVERYWARVESGGLPRPDLVIVDGGLGQVRAGRAALDRASTRPVALVGLAKREDLVVRERGEPIRLARRSAGLQSLQRLRDEAHRFGLRYHRTLRRRSRIGSLLDGIPGVGPARRAAVLKAFGSVAALRERTAGEIAASAGISLGLAERIHARLGAPGAEREAS